MLSSGHTFPPGGHDERSLFPFHHFRALTRSFSTRSFRILSSDAQYTSIPCLAIRASKILVICEKCIRFFFFFFFHFFIVLTQSEADCMFEDSDEETFGEKCQVHRATDMCGAWAFDTCRSTNCIYNVEPLGSITW